MEIAFVGRNWIIEEILEARRPNSMVKLGKSSVMANGSHVFRSQRSCQSRSGVYQRDRFRNLGFLLIFFLIFGALAFTISYDCRIRSLSSFRGNALR